MTKIYTKTGDKGETSLVGGDRVSKSSDRIDSYGNIDELNAYVGVLISHVEKSDHYDFLKSLQSILFTIGSNVACKSADRIKYKIPALEETTLVMLEEEIDRIENTLPPITNFILPRGSEASSFAHVCRTVCRRAERSLVKLNDETLSLTTSYINRLSDYFFVLSRSLNKNADQQEEYWKPQK